MSVFDFTCLLKLVGFALICLFLLFVFTYTYACLLSVNVQMDVFLKALTLTTFNEWPPARRFSTEFYHGIRGVVEVFTLKKAIMPFVLPL